MTERCSMFVDKTGWPDGPWMGEFDEYCFTHVGLRCVVRRDREDGAFRGYVEIPKTSPHRRGTLGGNLKVHGSQYGDNMYLTGNYLEGADMVACFDMGHVGDARPGRCSRNVALPYCTAEYAKAECRKLAEQVARDTPLRILVQDIKRALREAWRCYRRPS